MWTDEPLTFARILSSGEFWAALSGAAAAFLLGVFQQWRAKIRSQVEAGNGAVFALSQMYTLTKNIHNQFFVDRAAHVRKLLGREPLFFEYLPVIGVYHGLTMPVDELRFMITTRDPDLINRLVSVERHFYSLMEAVSTHLQLHKKFQERAERLPENELRTDELIAAVGLDLYTQLQHTTEDLLTGLPKVCDDLMEVANQLRDVLRYHFPTRAIAGFSPVERKGVTTPPTNLPPVPLWRRVLRWINGRVRRVMRILGLY